MRRGNTSKKHTNFVRTMLSYPLCPFFVVFCNVVGTSNERDFQLLQSVTDGVSSLVTENKYVNTSGSQDRSNMSAAVPGFTAPAAMYSSTIPSSRDTPQDLLSLGPNVSAANSDGFMASTWNDDMMWQLFQSQPSLDWFNADILDPTWDFNVAK